MSPTPEERLIMIEGDVIRNKERLSRLEGRFETHEAAHHASLGRLHGRITKVEVRVAYYAGLAAAIGSLLGAFLGAGIIKLT